MTKVQLGVCDAVARHFGVSRATIRAVAEKYFKEIGMDHPMLELDLTQQINITISVMCSKNTMPLSSVFFHSKLKKTELYGDIINAFGNACADVLAYYSGGALVVIYEENYYTGVGGILVRGGGEAYVCEPIAHYLESHFPKANYNDC